jgi:LuxR family transcriptional regulator, maltose regulon positive regulatory protein
MSKPRPRRAGNLLNAKLMPPRLHPTAIQRPDLLARLDNCLAKKLALVTAPTGFGKTTLVSMWLAGLQSPSAWLTLDENDNDPARFWTYLCTALRSMDAGVGKTTLSALAAPQPPSFQALLSPLVNDLGRLQENHILVLDEYHTINAAEIHDGLSFLIQHLPETLHLVIISRSEPPLPVGILRARGDMLDITTADLQFDARETQAFLQEALSADLSPAIVAMLQERTEGWAAGLQLAALFLQNKNTAEIEKFSLTFSGSHRYIADYLIKEVFERQPAAVQDFLIKTCFLTRLTASLCDAVTGANHGAAMLEHLERDNLFIVQLESGGDRTWYRYNALFAESIQYLGRQRLDEAAIQALFEKAGGWYESHGLLGNGIETMLAAQLFERAIGLIEKYIEIHDLSEMRTFNRWIEKIPQQDILRHPVISFTNAQIILYSSDRFAPATAARIEPFLQAAEAIWTAQVNPQRLGEVHAFRGNLAWWQGDFPKAFEYGRLALDELPEHDVLWRGVSLLIGTYEALNAGRILEAQDQALEARARLGAAQNIYGVLAAIQMLSEIFYWQGELEQAEQSNQQIQAGAVGDESMLDDQGIAALNLARIKYERNELVQAEQFSTRALELGQLRGNDLLQVQAAIQLARIHSARDDSGRARQLLKGLEASIHSPAVLRDVQNAQALIAIRANDTSSMEWWVKIVSSDDQNTLPVQQEQEAFTLARLYIAQGKHGQALDLLQRWKIDSARNGRLRSQVEALILEALADHANRDLSEAIAPLIEALSAGQAKGFRRIFLDEGARMAALLQEALSVLPRRSLSLYVTTLLHLFPSGTSGPIASAGPAVQIEVLSQQELRVLRLLVTGLSNADIARELVVSTNTIKTQIKSIYRKLDVTSRDEAREVARELKLLI